jgi:Tol biopolymer transport system component
MLARVAEGGIGMIDHDRCGTEPADPDRPPGRRGYGRWAGVLLVLAGLAAVLAILLPRQGVTPEGGPSGSRPDTATPSATDGAALPAEVLLYAATATGTRTWDIWVANWDGTGRRNLTRDTAEDTDPAWSPDRRRIVYASNPSPCRAFGCQLDLYAIDRDGQDRRRLTNTPQDERGPDWSPDGGRIAYTRSGKGDSGIWVMGADGGGQRRLTDDPAFPPDWAPDGERLLYLREARSGGNPRLYVINADGSGRRRIGNAQVWGRSARWSPDGTRIALSKQDAVWVVNADGSGLRRIRQSAADPFWTPDGRHLVFTAYGSGATPPELRRIDLDGRNEITLRP